MHRQPEGPGQRSCSRSQRLFIAPLGFSVLTGVRNIPDILDADLLQAFVTSMIIAAAAAVDRLPARSRARLRGTAPAPRPALATHRGLLRFPARYAPCRSAFCAHGRPLPADPALRRSLVRRSHPPAAHQRAGCITLRVPLRRAASADRRGTLWPGRGFSRRHRHGRS